MAWVPRCLNAPAGSGTIASMHSYHGRSLLCLQVMEFLKANVISLYCTGEAERLLDPISRLLAFSAKEVSLCKQGLAQLEARGVPLQGAAAAVDSATGYLGSWLGL